ncbi:Zinc finger, PHD-type [Corchorus olitorius]|uniref:Zinc finger, PHD-type n=1 Tax=Corchorus olitorius TaxID=93759 RepID=A0A1R3G393_9ROSI|nr:Zinc finger, PHD-type [Corchorus olitorius]
MEGNSIDHFLHSHPLKLIEEEEVNYEFRCKGCKESLSPGESPIYGCRHCKFYLHKACAELPKEIQHFFHPCPLFLNILSSFTCNACFKVGYGFSYGCRRCYFNMHVECAQRPNIESDGDCDQEIVQHFTHWHPLRLVDEINWKKDLQLVGCGICEKLISFDHHDSAAVYGCEECNFFVHKSCIINIPRQITYAFHPSCPLILLTTIFHYNCKGCDDEHFRGSLVFSCERCNFELDVKCALLPTLDQSKDADKIQYVGHQHPLLALRGNDNNKDKMIASEVLRCGACGEKWSLESDDHSGFGCERCYFFIHRQCAVELKQEIDHYFHPLHPLTLTSPLKASFKYCGACRGSIDEFLLIYRCDKCYFNLHLDCAKAKPKLLLKYEGHPHHLTFFDKTPAAKTPAAKTPDSPARIYCYICECKFIAEANCVISELLPSLTGLEDYATGDKRAISKDEENSALEASVAKINNMIAALRAKKEPLGLQVEQLEARLGQLKDELHEIEGDLKQLEIDRFLCSYKLNLNLKE